MTEIKWRVLAAGERHVACRTGMDHGWAIRENDHWTAYDGLWQTLGLADTWQAARKLVERHYDNLTTNGDHR